MNFTRNAASLFATSAVIIPLGIVTSIVLTRWLSVPDRGLFSLGTAFATSITVLAQLGWTNVPIYRLRRAKADAATLVGAGLSIFAGVSLVICVSCFLLQGWLRHRFLNAIPLAAFAFAVVLIPLQLYGNLLDNIARGMDRFGLANRVNVLINALLLVALVCVLVLARGRLVGAMGSVVVVRTVMTLAFVVVIVRETGLSFRIPGGEIRDSFRFGMKSYVQALADEAHERVDIFMLAYLLQSPAQIAYYSIAAGLVRRLKSLPELLGTAAFPQMAGMSEGDAEAFACRLVRHSVALMCVGALLLAAAASTLIPLVYGAPYRASVLPFLVLLPAIVFLSEYRVLARYFLAVDKQQVNAGVQLTAVGINVALNAYLIPRRGIEGAAIASLVSYGLASVLITTVFVFTSGRAIRELLVFRREDVGVYWRRWKELRSRGLRIGR